MTKKLTTAKAPTDGFSTVPGSQMGTKSRAVLELLQKGRPTNRLDMEMKLGYPVGSTLSRLIGLAYIKRSTYGSGNGCYEITKNGRMALGEVLASPAPAYAPIINATMHDPYIPSIQNVSRIGVARA